ncbi:MAG: branched-chain amino acid ABC transporter permease [Chloroflexi bacterium]|nr:branched-chain amino acid ABC transporter permease [Ardenticatenaceae bacterium]NOG36963.1 branched-chain amino acid ABC transporter permease [Chloroflexota bacterium]GIK54512.1 MAG: branched-chain amino acid ABC transporter permease [Chloroflexota bacterium]
MRLPVTKILLPVLLLAALLLPLGARPYVLSLAIEVMAFAIFAMSLDLLLGYTGLPSFGHAAFFGLGAYTAAYLSSNHPLALGLTSNLLLLLPVVVLVTAVTALFVGFFALRTSGVYFLMITLAFAQMLFSVAIRWTAVTGGSDGLPGIPAPHITLGPLQWLINSRQAYYFLALAFFVLTYWLLRRLVNSPFGWTLRGIRENEARMQALGYATFRYKIAVFIIAGVFAGLGGMLLALHFRHASPENLYWTISGQVMIMVIIGGAGTLTGPILGALLVRLFPQIASSYLDRWETVEGVIFILFVLFAPRGIHGIYVYWCSRVQVFTWARKLLNT